MLKSTVNDLKAQRVLAMRNFHLQVRLIVRSLGCANVNVWQVMKVKSDHTYSDCDCNVDPECSAPMLYQGL